MRTKHIEAGHECQLLQHTSSWVTRSVMRGIGPDRQSCSFDVRRLRELPHTSARLTEQGPCNPIHLSKLATMFLLREVEVTTARVSSWTLSISDKELTWHLPGSKSDHMTLGAQRMLPCFCDLESIPCRFHIALDHLQVVVRTFEPIGEQCEPPIFTEHGLRRFGGHTPRVSGAQFYAALGLEVNKIRLLARHSGETIHCYVQNAPLKCIRNDLGLALQGRSRVASSSRSSSTTVATARILPLEAKVE